MTRNIDLQEPVATETREVTLTAIVVVAVIFCLAGRASLLLAAPAGYATIVWPPAGIGLAAMLIYGPRIWPALFLGSFIANVWISLDAIAAGDISIIAGLVVIAMGACAQAMVATWLLRRFNVWPDALKNAKNVARLLLLGGPVSCLVNASIGVTALLVVGSLDASELGFNWLNWWVGDSIGVIVFAPLILVWTGAMGEFWRRRAAAISVPSGIALIVVVSFFFMASKQEQARIEKEFNDVAYNVEGAIVSQLNSILSVLGNLQSLFATTPSLDAEGFRSFTRRALKQNPELRALSWGIPVPHELRSDYENAIDPAQRLRFTELNAEGRLIEAQVRDSYTMVKFIEPMDGNQNARGLDVTYDAMRSQAMRRARDTGMDVATGRVGIIQADSTESGLLIFAPIYESALPPEEMQERIEQISGYAIGVVLVDKLITNAIAGLRREEVSLRVFDENAAPGDKLLSSIAFREDVPALYSSNRNLSFAGREWRVNVSANAAFFSHHRSPGLAMILAIGLLLCGVLGAFNLILASNERRESIRAAMDALTGLANRGEFERRLINALANCKSNNAYHAFAFIDLDKFKLVNDSAGHQAGDKLLQVVSGLIRSRIRNRDTLARLGGDEFGVLLEHCPLDRARDICEEICADVRSLTFEWGGETFNIGASIGVVALTASTNGIADAMTRADVACYAAKNMGRNQVHVDHLDSTQVRQRRTEIQRVADFRKTMRNDELFLYKQPIWKMDNLNGEPAIQELLLRLEGPHGEILAPPGMISIAERYGIMTDVDHWVIHKALQHGKDLCEECPQININLSGTSLDDESLVDFVRAEIRESGVAPEAICFEITEADAISNLELATSFINEMKQLGCRFALDDFGAGISSFRYLSTLPIDWLKIDGGLVERVVEDPGAKAMVAAIQQIADAMNIPTIAEWVSDKDILDALQEIGVNYVQGFALGKPVPIKDATIREEATKQSTLVSVKSA